MECSLSKEELAIWRNNPLSQIILKALKEYRQNLQQQLSQGVCLKVDSVEKTALSLARLVGVCEGISLILDMEGIENEPERE